MHKDTLQAKIKVKVLPRSSQNQILMRDDLITAKVSAPPVEGSANRALIALLAEKLGIPKGRIEIASGKNARVKILRVRGLSFQQVKSLLSENL